METRNAGKLFALPKYMRCIYVAFPKKTEDIIKGID
jgi:hypothetical protein